MKFATPPMLAALVSRVQAPCGILAGWRILRRHPRGRPSLAKMLISGGFRGTLANSLMPEIPRSRSMYRPEIRIVDCTIRDGGLMNDHRFSTDLVKRVFDACAKSGVNYCEIHTGRCTQKPNSTVTPNGRSSTSVQPITGRTEDRRGSSFIAGNEATLRPWIRAADVEDFSISRPERRDLSGSRVIGRRTQSAQCELPLLITNCGGGPSTSLGKSLVSRVDCLT